MTGRGALSPQELHDVRQHRFLTGHRFTCSCSANEVREEHGRLECARCGSPVVRRSHAPESGPG